MTTTSTTQRTNVSPLLSLIGDFHLTKEEDHTDLITRDQPHDPVPPNILHIFHIVMTGFWIIIGGTGIVTNFVNLRTFVRIGLEDSVTIAFFALALSDFSICSISFVEMQAFLCFVLRKEFDLWFYLPPVVPAFMMMCVRRIFNTTTILITAYLAVQRCLCVALPFHVRGLFTRTRTCMYLLIILTVSVSCHSLYIWRHHVIEVTNIRFNASQLAIYVPPGSGPYLMLMEVVLGIAVNITCQVIVLVCLVVMGVVLKRAVKFKAAMSSGTFSADKGTRPGSEKADQEKADKSNVKETQAIIQVALVSLMFIVTNSPYLAFGVANTLLPEFGVNEAYNNLYHMTHNIMFTAELINSSLNFLIYYKYNSRFRQACFNRGK